MNTLKKSFVSAKIISMSRSDSKFVTVTNNLVALGKSLKTKLGYVLTASLKCEISFLTRKSSSWCKRLDLLVCLDSCKSRLSRLKKLCTLSHAKFTKIKSSSQYQYSINVVGKTVCIKTSNNKVGSLYQQLAKSLNVADNFLLLY